MLKRIAFIFMLVVGMLALAGCGSNSSDMSASKETASSDKTEVMVLAAASLTDALNELKPAFEKEHNNVSVTYSFGSSGKLAQQIEQGAPADVFLSASKKDMDKLQDKNGVSKDSRADFAKNELVLIVPKNSQLAVKSFEDINPGQLKNLAVGEPESVPAGRYTKETFEKLGMWQKLQDQLVLGKDVRQVLTYVESGNADAGIVYASDAKTSEKVKVLATAKPEWHKPIVYPGAVVASTKHSKEAQAFLDYLKSEKGQEVLKKYGFQ